MQSGLGWTENPEKGFKEYVSFYTTKVQFQAMILNSQEVIIYVPKSFILGVRSEFKLSCFGYVLHNATKI